MNYFKPRQLLVALLLSVNFLLQAEGSTSLGTKKTLSGYIRDGKDGESLIGATVLVQENKAAVASNAYGFYSLSLTPGIYTFEFSYVGYATVIKEVDLTTNNVTHNIELLEAVKQLQEVVVEAQRKGDNIKKAEMSIVKMDMKTIKKIPALLGEVDVIKVIQMQPGVQSTSEGTSGFSVRGGSFDQNLIVLDEATVYNASHLMGFFSVFNNDAIKDVKLYKGDIPAAFGGRLSSLLDVRMKDGNSKEFTGSGGIGILSSRLTLEGPIIKDRTTFIVSGRRTYYDLFFPLFKKSSPELAKSALYFYDLNAKVTHIINENNRIYLSGYFGDDVLDYNNQFGISFGNKTGTLRWNHQYSPRLFSNLSVIASNYNYKIGTQGDENATFTWTSHLTDYSVKLDYNLYPNSANTIKFGFSSTHHTISPARISGLGIKEPFIIPNSYALEHGVYASNEQEITDKLNLKYGLRMSVFQNLGKATYFTYNNNYESASKKIVESNKFFNTYIGWEPRLGAAYNLTEVSSVKASYSRTLQFMQLAANSTGGMPLDVWFMASPNVKPQVADQGAIGYFHNFSDNAFETSVELFYKEVNNAIDFKDNAELLFNEKLEGEVRTGIARSAGAEFMVKYDIKKLSGWVSYTWSNTERKVNEINNGSWYKAPYDKPHSVNVISTYELNSRVSLSANWVYATGAPITVPSFRWEYENIIQKGYTQRNAYRLPAYHRLDLSVTVKSKSSSFKLFGNDRIWNGEWVFGIYNVYNRKNAWLVNFVDDPAKPGATYAEKVSILTILPSVTYNFKF